MSRSRPSYLLRHFPRLFRRGLHNVEPLEARQLLSAAGLASGLDNVLAVPAAHGAPTITNTVPSGYSPQQMSRAYGFNQLSLTGAGETIAIVDAYGDSKVASDLHAFDHQFGLSDPSLTVVNQNGGTRLPKNNSGWALETSLDVEWAHAMAPGANLLLVEANDSSLGNLLAAVDVARNHPGVVAVSMSWGAGEFASESSYDYHFTTPGVTFVAASGDSGGQVIWPAASPNVLSVGGTTLNLDLPSGTYVSESGWSGSGGGLSAYEPEPTYQSGVVPTTLDSSGKRATPDVAYNANPNTGVPVYDSISYSGQSGWFQVGGTSAGAPQWSGLVAVADQARQNAGQSSLANAQADLYSVASTSTTDFHDVTSGSAGGNTATSGYDLVTGLGTPVANNLVQSLASATATPTVISAASTTATSPNASSSTSSETDTDPPLVLIEFILFTTPHIESGVPVVPLIVTPATSHPAPAESVALPADTPVRFATNSILVDDPLEVPLKPAKRRATDSTPPGDEAPESGDAVSPADVFRVWQSGSLNDEDWIANVLAETDHADTTANVAEAADACFAEEPLFTLAIESDDIAVASAGLVDGRAGQFLGLTGMFLVAVLADQRRGSTTSDDPSRRTWLSRKR
ncbi:MAG TPA: S53 family peptidase [Pirellulales bacterium]|nr:S53 family peptidase [Pirellulales bacterium]